MPEKVIQSVCLGTSCRLSENLRLNIVKKHTKVIPDKKKIVNITTIKVYSAF